MDIEFVNEYDSFDFNQEDVFVDKITKVFTTEKVLKEVSLCFVFMSDDYLLEINKEHLNHDYYTDIITFPIEETEDSLEADIYISIDRVKDNAAEFEVDFNVELLRVVLHGVLHLCGYGDKTEAEIVTMRAKENYYINL